MLAGVRLSDACLGCAELSGRDLRGVDPQEACLFRTRPGSADMSRTMEMTQTRLALAAAGRRPNGRPEWPSRRAGPAKERLKQRRTAPYSRSARAFPS